MTENYANVILESPRGLQPVGLNDIFLRERKVFLVGEVTNDSCNELIKQLLYLQAEDPECPITMIINSPGGEVGSGLAVYDVIRSMTAPVRVLVQGIAASMGGIIFLACDKENRYMLKHSKIMLHDCAWGSRNMGGKKPHEVRQELEQLESTNERLLEIIAERTGKTLEEIAEVTKFDSYFDTKEAVEFGLIDESGIVDSDKLIFLMKKGA